MQSSKEKEGEIRKPSSLINAKKSRKTTEWERRDVFKKMRETNGTFHAKMGIKWYQFSSVIQSCPTLCDPRVLQARILEWVAFSLSRGSSQPRDQTQVSLIADEFLTS